MSQTHFCTPDYNAMAARLVEATATMDHFAAVTGIIERAIVPSSRTGRPVRFPPILMVSPPGVGKTFYCRAVAEAMATTSVPIAIKGTGDRGGLGGLSSVWRGAKLGKIAKGLLIDSATAAPLFLLDELDKPPALVPGENTLDDLLSALEPENARAFVDEYLDIPFRLDCALWLASANDTRPIPEPLLSRMVVVDVPKPTPAQAILVVRAIAATKAALASGRERFFCVRPIVLSLACATTASATTFSSRRRGLHARALRRRRAGERDQLGFRRAVEDGRARRTKLARGRAMRSMVGWTA